MSGTPSDPLPHASTPAATSARSAAGRSFGPLKLLRLLGKSDRTMAWLVADPRSGRDLLLALPRQQPVDAPSLLRWQQTMQRASRLEHPELAVVAETGVQDGWPYAAYDIGNAATLADRLTSQGLPGAEAAALCTHALRGLAFAHDAGLAHHDIQPYLVLVDDDGAVRLAGLAVSGDSDHTPTQEAHGTLALDADALHAGALPRHRLAAERDVLACGLVLHATLAGRPALDEPDISRAVAALPPLGRDIVRLPWTLAQPVADALRAIVNRATERQPRQRYRNARTLQRALEGWLVSSDSSGAGPIGLLADKLRVAGVLPSAPGAAARAARLAQMERERTNELAEVVLDDPGLCFELLRMVNSAHVRGGLISGNGPVLTVRRAIALLGEEGLRRSAAALRPWPGPLAAPAAADLARLMERCQRAAHASVALRPPGYDSEVVFLVTLIQSLGRLVLQYHFPEEAVQIRRLMQPAAASKPGEPDEPGMSEEAACFAVLGADVDALGNAVTRQWGMGDGVSALMRRLPLKSSVRVPESDDDMLRTVASCANEAADVLLLPAQQALPALQRVAQRYGRALGIDVRDLQAAFQTRPRTPIAQTIAAPLDDAHAAHPAALRALATKRALS